MQNIGEAIINTLAPIKATLILRTYHCPEISLFCARLTFKSVAIFPLHQGKKI